MITTTSIDPVVVRRTILEQSRRANVGHIGSCLCVTDILCAVYGGILTGVSPKDPDRDRFVLSKGHAGLALYAVLAEKGWIEKATLNTFCGDDSCFGVHPEHRVPGIDFCTGSLGHGLSMAAGAALAARILKSNRRVYCLLSDAECNEGSVWEAVMFAAHHRLCNLTAIIDANGQQALGRTTDVLNLGNLQERWWTFGWSVSEVDGHSLPALTSALKYESDRPHVVIAQTIFGKGVSYMEEGRSVSRPEILNNCINWHYLPMSEAEYQQALAELEATGAQSFYRDPLRSSTV
jgi:transketolase